MAEVGINITGQRSQTTADLPVGEFDYVVTVCDNAKERCPWFPAKTKLLHRSFDDPPTLAAEMVKENEKLDIYRRVRDEIRTYIESLPESFDD
jgi:arsenate reductase